MEYVQMTLNDWVEMKQKLRRELLGVKQSFVRIGFMLRQIEEQKLYEQDGYKSIAEFARTELGLEPSTTSRFISINREYSVDGYSEILSPEYAELGRSQLEEMLKLPEDDRKMVQPETSRQDIRNLKKFNKSEPETGVADDMRQVIEHFFEDNEEIFNAVFSEADQGMDAENIKRMAEIINPAGNRSYKKGLFFMIMYEDKIAVKKFGGAPQEMTWAEFMSITVDIFGEAAAGGNTWQRYFGQERQEEENTGKTPEIQNAEAVQQPDSETEEGQQAEEHAGKEEDLSEENQKPVAAVHEVRHFVAMEKSSAIENHYGSAWAEVVREYLSKCDQSGSEEHDLCIRQRSYRVVKKPEVTEFYNDIDILIFDVENERLKQEYQLCLENETGKKEIATAQKKPENTEAGKRSVESEKKDDSKNVSEKDQEDDEIPGQMEITKDMPEYCPDFMNKPEEPETEKEEIKEIAPAQKKLENTESEADFPGVEKAEKISRPYGSRKAYLDTLTEYAAALYIAAHIKDMRNMTFSGLSDAVHWEKWLRAEVDNNGEEIDIVG